MHQPETKLQRYSVVGVHFDFRFGESEIAVQQLLLLLLLLLPMKEFGECNGIYNIIRDVVPAGIEQ